MIVPMFTSSVIDFGKIKEDAAPVTFEFKIDPEFDLDQVEHYYPDAPCGCLSLKFDPDKRSLSGTFNPSKSHNPLVGWNQKSMKIKFRLKDEVGDFVKYGQNTHGRDPWERKMVPDNAKSLGEATLTGFVHRAK